MNNTQPPLWLLLKYAAPYRARILAASLCSIFYQILDLTPDILIGIAINSLVHKDQSTLAKYGFGDVTQQLFALGMMTLVVLGLECVFEYLYCSLWRSLAQKIQHEMRLEVYTHLQKLDMSYFDERSTGSLLSVVNDDINQLERFLDVGANDFVQFATGIISIGFILFCISPLLSLCVFGPLPFVFLIIFFFKSRLEPLYLKVRERAGVLAARISNNITGIAMIKGYAAEEHEKRSITIESENYLKANRSVIKYSAGLMSVIHMAVIVGFVFAIIVGGHLALQGVLDIGAYTVLLYQTQRLWWPFWYFSEMIDLYERAMASVKRVFDLLQTPFMVKGGSVQLNPRKVLGTVQFQNVTFSYSNGTEVFKNVSFDIPANTTTAIVGATGSGKSSLIKLILRLYDPNKGKILLDGKDISSFQLNDLRNAFGFVSQEVFLFHGTVKDNIMYGSFDKSFEEVVAAAKAAEAHAFIMSFPLGYDTIVGERGAKLSGGQRQRLSIARALLKKPPVLIFDEATSSIDNETEAAIQHSLEKIAHNHTIIIIAHRLSTIKNADKIMVLDKGRVVESGIHDVLARNGGFYQSLLEVQAKPTDQKNASV